MPPIRWPVPVQGLAAAHQVARHELGWGCPAATWCMMIDVLTHGSIQYVILTNEYHLMLRWGTCWH
jgi:hypothetical protein